MEGETRMSWLSGKPQRVLELRRPPALATTKMGYFARWSVMDDQIMLTLPSTNNAESPSLVFLADINASLEAGDDEIEFKQTLELPFYAARSRLLGNRGGFVTAEFIKRERKLIMRTHNWSGMIKEEKVVAADAIDGDVAIHGSSVALCVRDASEETPNNCLGTSNQIAIWDINSGNLTKIKIPQDERGPQCHRGNFQFATPSHIALGGHIDAAYDRPYSVVKSIPIASSEQSKGRYFHHGDNFDFSHDHDAIAIPGSSAKNDVVVHHHQIGSRFTAIDVGLLTGDIPSEAEPSPRYFTDPNYYKDLFHVFWDKVNARALHGTIFDRLPSLVGNKLLVQEDIEEYEHDEDNYHGFKAPHLELGTFQVLYLYDFDQDRCKALRQLSPLPERGDLIARLKEQNPDARVTVVSRMFYTSIEDENDMEEDTSPEWQAHLRGLYDTRIAREKGEAKFPTLEYDDPPNSHGPRMLFTRSMVCLPKIREGKAFAMTTSAIIEIPSPEANGYAYYFGAE